MIGSGRHQLTVTARLKTVRKAQLQRLLFRSHRLREYRSALPLQRSRALLSRSDSDATLPKPGKFEGSAEMATSDVLAVIDNLDPSSVTGRIDLGERTPGC